MINWIKNLRRVVKDRQLIGIANERIRYQESLIEGNKARIFDYAVEVDGYLIIDTNEPKVAAQLRYIREHTSEIDRYTKKRDDIIAGAGDYYTIGDFYRFM